jgi:hypothetical protein
MGDALSPFKAAGIQLACGRGAIEMGVHRFLHPRTEAVNGTREASFVQLWQYKDDNWKLTRVLSYDYRSAQAKTN